MEPRLSIRPYRPADREMVFAIAADTAFFGEPVEAYLEDRRLFCDAFYAYYTDWEPEHGWVAAAGGGVHAQEQVIGFLMGCVNSGRHGRIWRRKILPGIAGRLINGSYRLGRLSGLYATGLVGAALRGEFARADLHCYPAHLHINLASAYRDLVWATG